MICLRVTASAMCHLRESSLVLLLRLRTANRCRLVLMKTPLWILLVLNCGMALYGAGAKQLFNGKDLKGWARIPRHEDAPADQKPGFKVEDGLLVSLPDAPE